VNVVSLVVVVVDVGAVEVLVELDVLDVLELDVLVDVEVELDVDVLDEVVVLGAFVVVVRGGFVVGGVPFGLQLQYSSVFIAVGTPFTTTV
jgi:hypothetical protein